MHAHSRGEAMDYEQLVDSLSPDLVARLRRAVETGRWPDGRAVTPRQREDSLQAIIAWEERHLPEAQRTGFIDPAAVARAHGRREASAGTGDTESTPLRWMRDAEAGE